MKARSSLLIILLFAACTEPDNVSNNNPTIQSAKVDILAVPDFNEDSAYAFIESQVAFGPRVPNSQSHKNCGNYLSQKLTDYKFDVINQSSSTVIFDGSTLKFTNIIASSHPERKDRIMLCAHWDTRPTSDQDATDKLSPFDGANDGGSGVGILLEIARNISLHQPNLGIDIILFDAEDNGKSNIQDSYCLGSQYWTNNLHIKNYQPRYGILLDMVGAKNATFSMEGYSMMYAPHIVKKVWKTAAMLGYSHYFPFKKTGPITDDHYYINKTGAIQCIDIIQHDPTTMTGFGTYWHTQNDNIEIIDKNTLKAVGQTLLSLIYNEN